MAQRQPRRDLRRRPDRRRSPSAGGFRKAPLGLRGLPGPDGGGAAGARHEGRSRGPHRLPCRRVSRCRGGHGAGFRPAPGRGKPPERRRQRLRLLDRRLHAPECGRAHPLCQPGRLPHDAPLLHLPVPGTGRLCAQRQLRLAGRVSERESRSRRHAGEDPGRRHYPGTPLSPDPHRTGQPVLHPHGGRAPEPDPPLQPLRRHGRGRGRAPGGSESRGMRCGGSCPSAGS